MENKDQGSALITALFIMTLVAIAATASIARLQLDIYRTRISINHDKLYLASQAVTWWSMDKLSNPNLLIKTASPKGEIFYFPKKLQYIYPGIRTTGALIDLQAKFNLNNLQEQKFQNLFYYLLNNTNKTAGSLESKTIIDAIVHWIQPHQEGLKQDVFLKTYLKQASPYYPAIQPMKSVSELQLINGVSAQLYAALLPNITTLPETTPININTAPKAVLMALGNGLNMMQVSQLIEARGKKGFQNIMQITALLQKLHIPATQITLQSTYFLSMATTSINDSQFTVCTVIKRQQHKNGKISLSLILSS